MKDIPHGVQCPMGGQSVPGSKNVKGQESLLGHSSQVDLLNNTHTVTFIMKN